MGTNYYVVPNKPSIAEPIHIGKSSMGWMFLFHDVSEPYTSIPVIWHCYEDVEDWLYKYTVESTDYVIINEYDEIVAFDDFVKMVELKQEQFKNNPDNFTYCRNVGGYRFENGSFS